MKKRTTISAVILASLLCTTGWAQDNKNEDVTEYAFDDNVVEGTTVMPENGDIVVRQRDRARSLVKVRLHFVPEMLKSVEHI